MSWIFISCLRIKSSSRSSGPSYIGIVILYGVAIRYALTLSFRAKRGICFSLFSSFRHSPLFLLAFVAAAFRSGPLFPCSGRSLDRFFFFLSAPPQHCHSERSEESTVLFTLLCALRARRQPRHGRGVKFRSFFLMPLRSPPNHQSLSSSSPTQTPLLSPAPSSPAPPPAPSSILRLKSPAPSSDASHTPRAAPAPA